MICSFRCTGYCDRACVVIIEADDDCPFIDPEQEPCRCLYDDESVMWERCG